MRHKASIPALRRQIDRIDDQLLRLLNRRARLATAIAAQKARSNSGVYAPAREKGVLARLARANRGPLSERMVRGIFREIISASRALEQRLRIAYLGPEATFTHLAARQQFGAAAEYVPAASIADVFREVEGGRADLGVVPVENSTEGMVAHTLDLLADSPLGICAEISLPVRHNLLARADTRLGDVKRVVAHPQALAQCRHWLTEHLPGVPDRNVLALIEGADIVIYDGMYTDEEYAESYVGWGHSTWQEAVRLCRPAGVKRLVVFHHDPDHDDDRLDAIGRELEAAMPGAVLAREGMVLHP